MARTPQRRNSRVVHFWRQMLTPVPLKSTTSFLHTTRDFCTPHKPHTVRDFINRERGTTFPIPAQHHYIPRALSHISVNMSFGNIRATPLSRSGAYLFPSSHSPLIAHGSAQKESSKMSPLVCHRSGAVCPSPPSYGHWQVI